MCATGHIRKGFVDRDTLDERCVVSDDFDRGVAQPLVLAEMAVYENELRAEPARISSRHAALYTECLGFIGSRKNDSAADCDRISSQGWVEQLLHGRIEGVEVCMEDSGFHPDPSDQLANVLIIYTVCAWREENRKGRECWPIPSNRR
jgi:hypothetical protein